MVQYNGAYDIMRYQSRYAKGACMKAYKEEITISKIA